MVVDFLGREIKVGDIVLWSAHCKNSKSEMELRRGTVTEIFEKFQERYSTKVYIKINVDLSAPNLRLKDYDWTVKSAKSVTLSKYKDTGVGKDGVFAYVYVL